ncbi:hydrophobe/amphiphile efflux-1 family RND transporter [Helicobacter monodelphidis]|uniref:efflux RND transporter permease subunit n=1 Tax=Helicobacter sp. 15-1451 TaxID=2004995 RepID=UPI000DCBC322|nr:multidrug efflux RND transporter permease subunit [Helicobacter sp. 15-1451]RAX58400.1 hydrophobe/amphiphile efflux-1 family RND transporter [Helicobacter sp. 15-1451]
MFSKFFIERPIFATVISIIIVIAGGLSIYNMSIEEYPQVTPPQVSISTMYPGADAETLANLVIAPIEQAVNGVENMIYISSVATASGMASINVYFEIGTDPDLATIDVNNRLQSVMSTLPVEVQQQGITARKRSSSILEIVSIYSPDDSRDVIFLSNYALINVLDDLKRVKGVGDAQIFGSKDYSIRVWMRPDKLASFGITVSEVMAAIKEQNAQFATGQFGQEPIASKPMFTYTLTTKGRLVDAEEFGNIIIKAQNDGSFLRLKDVANVELGAANYSFEASFNGKPTIPVAIFLQSGANALEVSELVNKRLTEIAQRFPQGVAHEISFDTTKFVNVAINEVVKTFIEAILLVAIIVYLFLQNMRTTIIPLLAVPVSIIGAFAGMMVLGFSINLLTLFGLVLAIGIVVDDAIIVIENVERIHRSQGLSIKDATIEAMREIVSPVISIVLVLSAVFIPVSFLGGFTGQMYKQFAVTIVISVVLSGFVALTLTPALCTIFIKEKEPKPFWFVRKFNEFFDWSTEMYVKGVRFVLHHIFLSLLAIALIFATAYALFSRLPSSLVPPEDKGTIFGVAILPPASSLGRTIEVRDEVVQTLMANPNVKYVTAFGGFDFLNAALKSDASAFFVSLQDWDQRKDAMAHAQVIAQQLTGMFMGTNKEAIVMLLNPPPIMGLSITGGFEIYVQNRAGTGYEELNKRVQAIIAKASQRPELTNLRTGLDLNTPQFYVDLDREKAKAAGVSVSEVFSTMQIIFGSAYINDFNLYGRPYKVYIQSDGSYRSGPERLNEVFVRSNSGEMVPLSSLLSFNRITGASIMNRFNLFPAAQITGEPKPGFTSGDAIKAIEEVANEVLDEGYTIEWAGSSYQERQISGSSMNAFIFALIFVFLILAAQYERWLLPFAVITAVPFAVFGAILFTFMGNLIDPRISNDIYFQIGLVVLIGLSAKNAILIVEFAMEQRNAGKDLIEAALEGARLRFRPIVMTSLAFGIGVIPLVLSSGAGAASRHSIGVGVLGGITAASTIAIFFVPLFYVLFERLNDIVRGKKATQS